MPTLLDQQKVHREWLQAAHGDLRVVERALITAVERARTDRRTATSEDVLRAIREVQSSHPPVSESRVLAG